MRMAPCNIGNRTLSSSHIFLFLLVHLLQTRCVLTHGGHSLRPLLVHYKMFSLFCITNGMLWAICTRSRKSSTAQHQDAVKRCWNAPEKSGKTLNAGLCMVCFLFVCLKKQEFLKLQKKKKMERGEAIS